MRAPVLAAAALSAVAFASCGGSVMNAAPPAPSAHAIGTASSAVRSLKCFTADGGACSIATNGTVSLQIGSASDTAAGVYFASDNSLNGVALSQLKALSFNLTGTYTAGSPRISIPVSFNGSATTAYVYPVSCATVNAGSGAVSSTVDPIGSSGTACMEMQGFSNPQYISDWSTFVTSYGSATITAPPLFLADADSPANGSWTLSHITVRK